MNYAREAIRKIAGYTPGEQPQGRPLVKLNTNENPYPPSPAVAEALRNFQPEHLRLYSNPSAAELRRAAAEEWGVSPEEIIAGNGSDDILTILTRTFVGEGETFAFAEPSYSLYPVLADLQGARRRAVPLTEDFRLPENAAELAGDARLLVFARPNAPTGTQTPQETIRKICREFPGVVVIDEAYADFAGETCIPLIHEFPNVVISRTFSKSYSLAGLRVGLALAPAPLIEEMNKVKDSYNVDMLAQCLAAAAIRDGEYMRGNARRICDTRDWLAKQLAGTGCRVLPSSTNFLFVSPAHISAKEMFAGLRGKGYLTRYFLLPRIDEYVRISMGTREQMEGFLKAWAELDSL